MWRRQGCVGEACSVRRLILSLLALATVLTGAEAPPDTRVLPELTVLAPLPAADGAAGLAADSGRPTPPLPVLVSAQGSGAQADLSLRGSSFSEAGYAVAGLSLRNPQTEHFNAELPLPAELFAGLRALTGLDQALETTGHLVGSVDAEFAPVEPGTVLSLEAGEGGGYGGRFDYAERWGATGAWGGNAFGWHQHHPGLDYGQNRADLSGGGLRLQYRAAAAVLDTVVAAQTKDFGARGFYGASPAWPSTERTDDALFLTSWRLGLSAPRDYVRITASTRQVQDEYILNERDSSFYRNQHRTTTSAAAVDGRVSGLDDLALAWRVWGEDERIDSHGVFKGAATAGLGTHDRQRLGAMLVPEWTLGPLTVRGGGQVVAFRADSPAPLALAGLEYALGERHRLYATCTQQVRQPSYTELDYESPASLGNAGLENEKSTEYETGVKTTWSPRWQTRAALFRRQTQHTVDWVRQSPTGRWLATDLGRVTTDGVEAEASCRLTERLSGNLFGQWLAKEGEADVYASRYVYNYTEQRGGLAASWRPWTWCEVRTQQVVLVYADNPARTTGRWGTDSSLAVSFHPACWPAATFGIEVANLYDDDTQLYPGQRRAHQQVMGTLTTRW